MDKKLKIFKFKNGIGIEGQHVRDQRITETNKEGAQVLLENNNKKHLLSLFWVRLM